MAGILSHGSRSHKPVRRRRESATTKYVRLRFCHVLVVALSDSVPPVVARLDAGLVKPDIMAALLQVGMDAADQFLACVVAVAEEDA